MAKYPEIVLETLRLNIIPLSYPRLFKYTNLDYTLEEEMGLEIVERTITPDFRRTLENYLIPYLRDNPLDLFFATIWIVVLRKENLIIGDIGFNSRPSDKGVIEVGYSTYPAHMNNGYMTEALKALTIWAFQQRQVNIIIAQTNKDNIASQAVLKKNNFTMFVELEDAYWWRLDK